MAGFQQVKMPYTIKGRLLPKEGRVWLLAGKDTLGGAELKNGGFLLRGNLQQPEVGFLVIDGKRCPLPLFLEKGKFYIGEETANRYSVEGGGSLQRQERDYQYMLQKNNQQVKECEDKLAAARKERKLFEVMMHRATLESLDSVRDDLENQFIAAHPESLVSLYHFYEGLKRLTPAQLEAKYPLLGAQAKQTAWGKVITAAYENWNKLSPGHTAPDFTLNTPDGRPVRLHEVKARVKLLDFWASWCGPCRAESPELVRIYQQYKDQGLEIVSVSLDSKLPAWKKAIETDGLHWIHLSSLQGWHCPVASLYRIHSVPSCFVLDADNRIVAVKVWGKELEEAIKRALKDKG